jgi:Transposase zinc-binding domain/Putative transposase
MREHISGAYTIKQIFEDDGHWARFQSAHPHLRQNIPDEVEKMLRCKDPQASGYHRYACPDHPGESIVVPHTCKSRFCSSCGKVMTDQWIEKAMNEFLDVPYHHIVFTMPSQLWNIFPYDRNLLNILFLAAERTVLEWCEQKGGYVPGVVCVLHTFGSILNFNTHIHMLITEGGLSPDRTSWISNEYIPWKMLKSRWKYWILELLEPEVKRLINEGWIHALYRELGVGNRFLRLLEDAPSQNLVRLDGMHVI